MNAPKIFISHKDRYNATQMQVVLESTGADTFLDQDEIQAGDNLPNRITKGINWCNVFLLLWSFDAAKSVWVEKEWNKAYDSRKKIIPYLLYNTPLPYELENLVFVESEDKYHGNAALLKAIFGHGYTPNQTTLFPGVWEAEVNAFGMASGWYILELRTNGQITGKGGVGQSGMAATMIQDMGMGHFLNIEFPISGTWTYEQGNKLLTLTVTASGFGQTTTDIVKIITTGRERGEIQGQDIGGRTWTIRRPS